MGRKTKHFNTAVVQVLCFKQRYLNCPSQDPPGQSGVSREILQLFKNITPGPPRDEKESDFSSNSHFPRIEVSEQLNDDRRVSAR